MKKKTDNRVGVGPLKDSCSELITDDETMAEILNASFCSVFTEQNSSYIPTAEQRYCGDNPLVSVHITTEKVQKKLERLKPSSAPGPDKLWPRVLQKAARSLSFPLAIIYTKCLAEVTVPQTGKLLM